MWAIHRPQRAIPPTDSGFKCPWTQETVFAWRNYTERGIFYLDFKFEKLKRAGWKNKLYTDAVYPVNWFSHPICQANMLITKPFDKILVFPGAQCSGHDESRPIHTKSWFHHTKSSASHIQTLNVCYNLPSFTCIYHRNKPNVGRCTIHWVSGISTEVPSIFLG